MIDLKEKTKKGMLYVSLSRICTYIIEFVGGIIVARLLFPQDFGIMAIAMIFIHLGERLGEFGFNVALIQKEKITHDHIFTVFTINFGIAVILCLSLVIISPFIGKFFNNDLVGTVLSVVAINFLLRGLSSTPLALLQRELSYRRYALVSLLSTLFSSGSAILFAFLGFKVWSLVLGRLIGTTSEVISSMVMAKWIPKFRYKSWALKEVFSFGLWIFLRGQVAYFIKNIDYFIVSKRLGVVQLGFYDRGASLVNASQRLIGIGVQQVSFSAFSRIQKDAEFLKTTFQKVLLGLTFYNYPIPIGMLLIAPSFIPIVYGEKWIPAILPFQILCIATISTSIEFLTTALATAKGKLKRYVITLIIYFIILAIACFRGSYYGIIGVAIGVVISNILFYILLVNLLISLGGFKLKDILTPQIPTLTYVSIMVLGVKLWELLMKKFWPIQSWFMLISSIIIGCILYVGAFLCIKFKEVEFLKQEFSHYLTSTIKFIRGMKKG